MANAFWIILLVPALINNALYGPHYHSQVFFQPSEDALKSFESLGVKRAEVQELNNYLNETHPIVSSVADDIFACDDQYKKGNMTHEQFLACAALIVSYTQHMLKIAKEEGKMDTAIESIGNYGNISGNITGPGNNTVQ